MSSDQSLASQQAMATNRGLATDYYNIALPTLEARNNEINAQLRQGEPGYLSRAYQTQRTGLTEGAAAQGALRQAQATRSAKGATLGGNAYASMHPVDMGAQMANALYGSKFQEGQANIDQTMNLMNMGMGGAGTAGSGALDASGNQLRAIGYLPNYNQNYATALGAANLAGSIYGAYSAQPTSSTGTVPPGTAASQGYSGWA